MSLLPHPKDKNNPRWSCVTPAAVAVRDDDDVRDLGLLDEMPPNIRSVRVRTAVFLNAVRI